jgi:hypothetical protein
MHISPIRVEGQRGAVPGRAAVVAREPLNTRYASLSLLRSNHENLFVSDRTIFLPGLLTVRA